MRVGFPVPPGFVATAAAYEWFVADNRLAETIDLALQRLEGRNNQGGGHAIRAAFESAAIPRELERKLLAAYLVRPRWRCTRARQPRTSLWLPAPRSMAPF